MEKTAVVYQSRYGFTEKYAKWIAEELSCGETPCDLLERRAVKAGDLAPYGTIVYGGGLYAGGVSGIDLLTRNFDSFASKNLVLFTCGLADPDDPANVEHIRASLGRRLTPQMQSRIRVFHLRGGIDYERLGPAHRAMMGMLRRMVAKKPPETQSGEEKELLRTYGGKVDFTERSAVAPIVDYVRSL